MAHSHRMRFLFCALAPALLGVHVVFPASADTVPLDSSLIEAQGRVGLDGVGSGYTTADADDASTDQGGGRPTTPVTVWENDSEPHTHGGTPSEPEGAESSRTTVASESGSGEWNVASGEIDRGYYGTSLPFGIAEEITAAPPAASSKGLPRALHEDTCPTCSSTVKSRFRPPLVVVPNPTVASTRRVVAGDFSAAHTSKADPWVTEDNAGALIRITLSDVSPGAELMCMVSFYDMVGNLVNTSKADNVVLPGDRVLDIYWNCTNARGYPVQAGVYRAIVLIGAQSGERETVWYKGYASVGVRSR